MRNLFFCSPFVLIALIATVVLFPPLKVYPDTSNKIDRLIRLRKSEKQRLTNEQRETIIQIDLAEKRTERVLEVLGILGQNIERSQKKLKRLKESMLLLKKQIKQTGKKISTLEVKIEEDKEEINQQLLALFYISRVKKMTLFIGLSSFEHYFRNQKLLQISTQVDIELLNRYNQNLTELQTENEKLNRQRIDLADLQLEEEDLKKLLVFERQQQVTYLQHLRADRKVHVRYLREIQMEMEQLNDKLYSLTVKKEDQKKTSLFSGFYDKKNSLVSPVIGKIVHRFGQRQSPFFTLFNRGVVVETATDEPVRSVLPGKVGYAGLFRGYQNLVILDHGKGSFSVYGNLAEFFVLKDDVVDQGHVLGSVAYDEVEERSLFYFEMRYNKKAVNPARWLKKPQWK